MADNINKLIIQNEFSIEDTSNDHRYIFTVNELIADRNIDLPLLTNNDIFVFESHSQTLTNKTFDATLNTLLNITNTNIKSDASIDATKIYDGSISNTEFGYLNGVSSNIQTQLNSKASSSHNHSTTDLTSGILSVSRGGIGVSSLTANNILQGNGTNGILSTLTAPSGDIVGTTDTQTITNKTLDSTTNIIVADKLHSATTTITINSATAPTSGQVLTATSGNVANWQTPIGGGTLKYIDVYSTSTSTFEDTYIDVTLDIERHKDSDFTHLANSEEITINTTDTYELTWIVSIANLTTTTMGDSICHLMLDTGSGYNEVAGSTSYGYHRKDVSYNSHGRSIIMSLNNGDKVKLQVKRYSNVYAPILSLVDCGSSITIKKLTI